MQAMQPIDKQMRTWLEKLILSTFGIESIGDYILVKAGGGKIKLTTEDTLNIASKMRNVQSVGIYVMKVRGEDVVLSIEGSQLFCKQIKINRIELTEEQVKKWMSGAPIEIQGELKSKYVVASYRGICVGCGRVSRDGKIYPQIPKWRSIPLE